MGVCDVAGAMDGGGDSDSVLGGDGYCVCNCVSDVNCDDVCNMEIVFVTCFADLCCRSL